MYNIKSHTIILDNLDMFRKNMIFRIRNIIVKYHYMYFSDINVALCV